MMEHLLFNRMIRKRFGESVAESAWVLLQTIEKSDELEQLGDWLLDCETGEAFLACLQILKHRTV